MLHPSWWLLEKLLLLMRLHHGYIALHVEVLLAVDDIVSCCLKGIIGGRLEGLPVVAVWHSRLMLLATLRHIYWRGASDRAIQIRLFRVV